MKAQKDLLFFNWVPRSGGEQFIEFMNYLADEHGFSTAMPPRSASLSPRYSKYFQEDLAKDILKIDDFSQFSMHMNFINFTEFNLARPIYINLIRDPLERVISWFYFRRSPWVAAQMFKKTKKFLPIRWYKKTFEECVLRGDPECTYIPGSDFEKNLDHRRQTLFFCGHSKECEPFNSEVALQMAKRTVETEYAVVGSLEDLNVTLSVLEGYIPKYFKDATKIYHESMGSFKRNMNGWKPAIIKEEVRNMVKKNFTMEYEFYNFCKQRLYNQFLALKVGK